MVKMYFFLLSLCTIHSVRKSGILPVFVTCVISRLHIKVSDQERIRLWLVPPILWANYDKLHYKIQRTKNHDPKPTKQSLAPLFPFQKNSWRTNFWNPCDHDDKVLVTVSEFFKVHRETTVAWDWWQELVSIPFYHCR